MCYRGRGWGRWLPAAYCTRTFTCTTDWDPYKDQGQVVTFYGGNALCSQRLTPTHRCVAGGGDGGGGCRQHIVRAILHVPLIGTLIRIKVQSWRFTEETLSAALNTHSAGRGGGRGGGVIEGAIVPLGYVFKNRFFKTVQITRLISVSPLFLIIFKNMNCVLFFFAMSIF